MRLTQFCHVVQQEEFRAKQGGGVGEANEGDISTIPTNGDLMVQQMTFLKMTGVENGPLVEFSSSDETINMPL